MIGSLMMRRSVVVLLVGMLAGIVMGTQQNFALRPAYACPACITDRPRGPRPLPRCRHMIGAILFPAGVAVVLLKGDSFIAAPRRVGR
jgi:hypothetical protein